MKRDRSLPPADEPGAATTVCIYQHPLPPFVESELAALYQNVFASLARLRALGLMPDACAYVARRGQRITCLLLFRRHQQVIEVFNEAIRLPADELARFTGTVFAAFPTANVVSFHAIEAALTRLPFPSQQFNCLEDIVLELPASEDAYFSALGKNMRTSLKRYQKKIAADLPTVRYDIYHGQEAGEQQIAAIVALSSARIASKHQVPSHTDARTAELIRLVRECGVVLVASSGERVLAGVICTHFGGNFFMHVVAHDPLLDDYRLGKICCYLSICDAIARGAREYHFLWGRYEYKYRLLGVQRELDRIVIYRSRIWMVLNFRIFLNTAWRGYSRRAKRWLGERQPLLANLAGRLQCTWRRLSGVP
jgi:hypothetical protein